MNNKLMFSRNSDEWSTPEDFYEKLNKEFNFTLDPCATDENRKTTKYFTKEQDGLCQSWQGNIVFCNPPYSNISKWVKKCYYESLKENTTVVLLIPARTDTKYFHNYILNRSELRFVKGRLKFGECKNSAPFPSMIVIFRSAGK